MLYELRGGEVTVLERWPESSGRGLDHNLTRRAFTCSFSFNAQRVIRKRGNDDLSPVRGYPRSGVSFLTFLEISTCVLETGPSKVPQVRIPAPILSRRNARKIHGSLDIADQ